MFFFLTRSLTLGILFSKVIRAVVLTNLVILDISFLILFILALDTSFLTKSFF